MKFKLQAKTPSSFVPFGNSIVLVKFQVHNPLERQCSLTVKFSVYPFSKFFPDNKATQLNKAVKYDQE